MSDTYCTLPLQSMAARADVPSALEAELLILGCASLLAPELWLCLAQNCWNSAMLPRVLKQCMSGMSHPKQTRGKCVFQIRADAAQRPAQRLMCWVPAATLSTAAVVWLTMGAMQHGGVGAGACADG